MNIRGVSIVLRNCYVNRVLLVVVDLLRFLIAGIDAWGPAPKPPLEGAPALQTSSARNPPASALLRWFIGRVERCAVSTVFGSLLVYRVCLGWQVSKSEQPRKRRFNWWGKAVKAKAVSATTLTAFAL
jgi:hypothetical protein